MRTSHGYSARPIGVSIQTLVAESADKVRTLAVLFRDKPTPRALTTRMGGIDLVYLNALCLGHRLELFFDGCSSGSDEYAVHLLG